MNTEDVSMEISAHDKSKLDIIVECPECGHRINAFLDTNDEREMIDL